MAKGYWLTQSDVTDEAQHAIYEKAVRAHLQSYGARMLVRTDPKRSEVPEGSARKRLLVQEFPDYETALACYHSEAYREIRKLRLNAAVTDVVIAEGWEPTTSSGSDS